MTEHNQNFAIGELSFAVKELVQLFKSLHPVSVHDLKEMENRIMSKFTEFATALRTYFDREDAALGTLKTAVEGVATSVNGVAGDVTTLNELITQLKNSPGPTTPEEEATMAEMLARGDGAATKLEAAGAALQAASAALAAVDALTPPAVPPTP